MKSSFSQEDLESKLESYLNEFYHQKIVPLEKEIIRLGGKLDFEDQRSREIYPCYYCGNLTVTRSKKPRCSNPKCRRKINDFIKQDNFLKCPYCKKYDMEFEKVGLWD